MSKQKFITLQIESNEGKTYPVSFEVRCRQAVERAVIKAFVTTALAKGAFVSVYNDNSASDDSLELEKSDNLDKIMDAIMSSDEDVLVLYKSPDDGKGFGWVRCIYGNEGWDVISDYTTNLDIYMFDANAVAHDFE